MRDDLTFHASRFTAVADSGHLGCAFIFSNQANSIFKNIPSHFSRMMAGEPAWISMKKEDADSADASQRGSAQIIFNFSICVYLRPISVICVPLNLHLPILFSKKNIPSHC